VISPDGKMIAYSVMQTQGAPTAGYLMPVERLIPQKIHNECDLVWSWLPDGRSFICGTWDLAHGHLMDVASRSFNELMRAPDNSPVFKPSFSSDGRWLLFGTLGGVYIAPFHGRPIAKSEWHQLFVTYYFDEANDIQWSPDANLIYFTSVRDGSRCVWAQRLDPSTKKLLGDAWPVCHFHSARRSIVNVGAARMNIAVRNTDLILPLGELTGNVWMTQLRR
jgi:Tol biopolymer transport system component